jgi:hypothetical protein
MCSSELGHPISRENKVEKERKEGGRSRFQTALCCLRVQLGGTELHPFIDAQVNECPTKIIYCCFDL